jgi:hypothetical protein
MCALKSRGMSAVCTWGLREIFFLHMCFLCSSPMVLCTALWQASFLRMYRTMSKTPNFMLKYELRAYAYGTYDHLPCAKTKKKVLVPRRIVR